MTTMTNDAVTFARNRSFYDAQVVLLDHLLSMDREVNDDRIKLVVKDLIRVLTDPQKPCDNSCWTNGTDNQLFFEFLEEAVPSLLDYQLVNLSLDQLVLFLIRKEDTCKEINKILLRWTKKVESRLEFRQWFIQWLLSHKKQVISCDNTSTWSHALEFAAAVETDTLLKYQLKLLAMTARNVDASDILPQINRTEDDKQRINTPEDLLKFYWFQADELSPFSLLCARKFQALVHSKKTIVSTECRVILKWGRYLKRSFFEPFVRDVIALKGLDSMDFFIETLQLSPILEKVVPSDAVRILEYGQKTMPKRRENLLKKYKRDPKCIYTIPKVSKKSLYDVKPPIKLAKALELELHVSEIVRDLEFAPSYLYPWMLAVLEEVVLSHQEDGVLLTEQTASMLFEMILYTKDESNCLDLLGFLLLTVQSFELIKEAETTNSIEETLSTLRNALQLVQESPINNSGSIKHWCIQLIVQLMIQVQIQRGFAASPPQHEMP